MNATLELTVTTARGRNGWFDAKTVSVDSYVDDKVWLNVYSKRQGEIAPIVLQMSEADACDLTSLLFSFMGKKIREQLALRVKNTPATPSRQSRMQCLWNLSSNPHRRQRREVVRRMHQGVGRRSK